MHLHLVVPERHQHKHPVSNVTRVPLLTTQGWHAFHRTRHDVTQRPGNDSCSPASMQFTRMHLPLPADAYV